MSSWKNDKHKLKWEYIGLIFSRGMLLLILVICHCFAYLFIRRILCMA